MRRSARHPRRRDRGRGRATRSRRARAARRASPTGCCKRVRDFAEVRSDGRRSPRTWPTSALELLEVDARRARAARPRDPAHDRREVRGRAGRALDARGRGRRGAGHDRGRLRAVPAPAGPDQAHARAAGSRPPAPTSTSGSSRKRQPTRALTLAFSRRTADDLTRRPAAARPSNASTHPAGSNHADLHLPELRNRLNSGRPDRRLQRQRRAAARSCGFGFLFELLDDYYPDPNAAFFVCDREARVIGCGTRQLRADRPGRRGDRRPAGEGGAGAAVRRTARTRSTTTLEWGVRVLGKHGARRGRGRPARRGDGRRVSRLRRGRRAAARPDARSAEPAQSQRRPPPSLESPPGLESRCTR